MESNAVLTCSVNLEWLNNQGTTQRKVAYKTATLRLTRNEFQDIFLEIAPEKGAEIRLKLKSITVHNKFMNDGKATIKFQQEKCTVMLVNAAPSQLISFLRTIFVKMTGDKSSNSKMSLRAQLLSNKPKSFEEISPVTMVDLENAHKKISRSTDTTPSPSSKKRKISDATGRAPVAKKLLSAIPNEVMTDEQKRVFDACMSGLNVFFTGSAGTGKSFLLKKIIAALPPNATAATASTGVAACHIGGTTLHQFAGIGRGEATLERSFVMASKSVVAQGWRKTKHLIIDEISMIDADYFEKVEEVARYVRRNDKPFGGIQLILCGDFLQLPPVTKRNETTRFCFQSPMWERCVQRSFELSEVHRQHDSEFINILNKLRLGEVPKEVADKLMATSKQIIELNGILATRLCSHTNEAIMINESKLKSLEGESVAFNAVDSDGTATKQLDEQTPVASQIILKIGAQVMLLKNLNISSGLVNGARGVVVGFEDNLPVVTFRNQKCAIKQERWLCKTPSGMVITRMQVPLKLAWAFSIHKSQGLTLDCVEMSLGKVFEAGQAYVALSRAKSMDTLRILDFKASQVWANPTVVDFYKKLRRRLDDTEIIPLGRKNTNSKSTLQKAKGKLSKMIMDKPLVSIS
ncbi:hypothetical protein PPYR_11918 [Photinus pyralis]|uniref:ATP-dependent DNA helicase PIF1 n=1 Tax=Photinus pyralis TaxID=7054 RepID=A0A1Y1NF23_PHOPY|nr:ATP-dependent DNA helicase PIF1 [Photinus pyralis]XP_031351332.1 ATP-dependent DNA helicase PIF1 [Photinus pyralis]KAB0795079.1 hypothetical protein PPYR_11918 [Photinus pyralis]